MRAPTYVSTDRKVTDLLGYHWVCEPGVTIPKTKPDEWSIGETNAVVRALECGKLKTAIKPPLHLNEKGTRFAEDLLHDKAERYRNCVYLMRYGTKRRTISSCRQSANSTSPPFRLHTDDRSIDVDENGDYGFYRTPAVIPQQQHTPTCRENTLEMKSQRETAHTIGEVEP
jgi:hypothetical protein